MPKIQRFLWRACASGLAIGDALNRRNINVDPLCGHCGECETTSHILLGCAYAKVVWFGCPLGSISSMNGNPSISDWIYGWKSFSNQGKKEARSLITLCSFVCWFLWLSRIDLVFGRRLWHPSEIISAAVKAFQEFMDVQSIAATISPTTLILTQRWIAPSADFIKCNCDASLSLDLCRSGIGFICRDHRGMPLIVVSDPISFSDVMVGEAHAIRMALLEMIKTGFAQVMVESDNINLITHIQDGGGTSPLLIRVIIDDIIHLSSFFVCCSFTYIPRGAWLTPWLGKLCR
ncbi:uncharacterized protein LOC122643295 [Telopea speciosissima]|uniref:uncharacterized protein LOC122643295 n=1 Tax=Telopea speciosissima TaxID=54955 RepID=UPI001CC50578|nr:uncharacterized protein LOC122643295 [Telopea speciosissima]